MTPLLTLAQWLAAPRPASMPIAWLGDRSWTLGHLRHDVDTLLGQLQQQDGERWALCVENSYLFIVALLATLHAGKTPVIPGHHRLSLLNEQRDLFDGVLSDRLSGWQGRLLVVASEETFTAGHLSFPAIRDEAVIELFTSGSTGQPKRIVKPVTCLDREVALLAARFASRMSGCRVVASVVPQHQYGLTFRIFLPMALGLPLHAATILYAEQLAALSPQHRYAFISSPAFLKRLDPHLPAPPVTIAFSAGGILSWQDAKQTSAWLAIWPDEIYGSTETGVLAWRALRHKDAVWQPFAGVTFRAEGDAFRVFSPLLTQQNGLLLDDILQFSDGDQFRLMGRRGRVVKIEDKRISLSEVETRLVALDGIREAAALPVTRGERQAVGVLLVLEDEARLRWQEGGGQRQESAWRRALQPWLEPVAVPRYWRVVDEIPVNSMNKRVYTQLQELFHETP